MTKFSKGLCFAIGVIAIVMMTVGDSAWAKQRSRSGGGFRSGSSRSSSSGWGNRSSSSSNRSSSASSNRSSSSSSNRSGTASSNSNRSSGWGNTRSSSGSRSDASSKKSTQQRRQYENAVKNGTAFKTKAEAQKDFKSKYASKYTSKYDKEPATRPSHIPQTSQVDGKTVNITYNQASGGYGYWGGGGPGLGTFIMYDMMSDAIMMNAMMNNQGYHYGPAPPVVVEPSSGSSFLGFVIGFVILVIFGVVVFAFIKGA